MGDVALGLLPLVTGGLGAWLASDRGRSAVGWFFLSLVFGVIGLGILAGLPRLRFSCPLCTHPYDRGAKSCASCGASLPAEALASRLTPGLRYDLECPGCGTPYREEDYQPDADQIFCSFCRTEVPRRASTSAAPRPLPFLRFLGGVSP